MNERHIDLVIADVKADLGTVLNSSGLPLSVLNMIVGEMYRTVAEQHQLQLTQLRQKEIEKTQNENEQTE